MAQGLRFAFTVHRPDNARPPDIPSCMPRTSLSISSRSSTARLTPEQERFRYLIRQIETVRDARAAWEKSSGRFRTEHSQRLQPLRATLRDLSRGTVLAIDALLEVSGWSRADRATLRQMLCVTAEALLAATPDDAELQALFDKHSDASFENLRQEEIELLKEEAEELTGLDLGDDTDIRTEEELVQRMYEKMAEREAAEEEQRADNAQRHRNAAQKKRSEAAAQLVRQSLREIYRKLASAVHPDRESDPRRRDEKNALMQRINQAYAANDLLALFELQIEVGHTDIDQISAASAQRLKQYNKLLAQQLNDAKSALRELQQGFRMDFGLDPGSDLNVSRLNLLTQRRGRELRAEIARQKELLALLSSRTATRRWLKEQRRFAMDDDF